MELSNLYFACLKLDFSSERREQIEYVAMTFYIDDFDVQSSVLDSLFSTETHGIMYQISKDVITDFLPHRTALPGMATTVLLRQVKITRLPHPYGDCIELQEYTLGPA